MHHEAEDILENLWAHGSITKNGPVMPSAHLSTDNS